VFRVLRRVLDDVGISVEVCTEAPEAREVLQRRRFDAVIIDCDDVDGAREVLQGLRQTTSNRKTITFAVVNRRTSVGEAFSMGAHFVLDKPLSMERAARSLRAAHGVILRERRRYFRQPFSTPVLLGSNNGKILYGRSRNLSESGMSVGDVGRLEPGTIFAVSFDLPGSKGQIEVTGEVSWVDEHEHAGLRFLELASGAKRKLEQWLATQTEEVPLPAAKPPVARAR